MNRFYIIITLFLVVISFNSLSSQCTPPEAEVCDEANVLCSLDEVSGYTCQNNSSQASGCTPLCSQGGVPHNTGWWAFVCDGGNVTVTITILGCVTGQGMQFGIWGDCACGQEIACQSIPCVANGSFSIQATLSPCKLYYLWVDGCSGDVCDFTLTTSGGARPRLNPISPINNDADRIIEPVCKGYCGYRFFVNPQPNQCEPVYVWELDGVEVGGNDDNITLDFPDEGDFVLCVTAYIGNPESGSICSQEGPVCATIRVRPIPDKLGPPRVICYEQVPFKWHCESITSSGEYRCEFTDTKNCCKFDSVVEFIVLDKPFPENVYHISCDDDPYYDLLGRPHVGCRNEDEIPLPKTTDPYKCDSSILLSAVYPKFVIRFDMNCIAGEVEVTGTIQNRTKTCGAGETYEYQYKWYKKSDPKKLSLGSDDRILVAAMNEDYCLDILVTISLGTEIAICALTFCELLDEGNFAPYGFPMGGPNRLCLSMTGWYYIDTLLRHKVTFYNWTVEGGSIISKIDSSAVEIRWDPRAKSGRICLIYETDCGPSPETCKDVELVPAPDPQAGPDQAICALSNTFKGTKDRGGSWTQISGPPSTIIDPTDPQSVVNASTYGSYRYVYYETYLGCDGSDTVNMLFNSNPDSIGVSYICNLKQTQFRLRFQITQGTPPYKIISGTGTIDTLTNVYLSSFLDNLTMNTIIIEDAFGCRLEFPFTHECKCTNGIGNLNKIAEAKCEHESFIIDYDNGEKLDANDTLIFVVVTDPLDPQGTIIEYLNSRTVQYNPAKYSFGTDYYIFVFVGRKNGMGGVDFLAGCAWENGPKPFRFYKNPTPDAGLDDAICGTIYTLKGVQSINGTLLNWKLITGSGVSFSNPTSAGTDVNTNGGFGTYVFELEEDNNNCPGADRVQITFNPSPALQNVEKICVNFDSFTFRVEALILGGQGPFTLLAGGGTIIGNKYFSDTLLSLVNFTIQVSDANGCISNLIVDTHNCNCGFIDAGQLDTIVTEVCIDQCVNIRSILGETIDPAEDIKMYIFHKGYFKDTASGNLLGVYYSDLDRICFDPNTMNTGIPYYLTRVVGDDDSPRDNFVDFTDPCLRNTKNQPIIWYDYPIPEAGTQDEICFFNYQLNGITNTGNPTWRFLSGAGSSTITNSNNDVTNVTVTQYGKYLYELEENFKGCISRDTVEITHHGSPNFVTPSLLKECDNIAENYRITVQVENGDLPTWFVNSRLVPNGPLTGSFINSSTWQTDWIPTGIGYELIVNDQHDCLPAVLPGLDTCQCITAIGNLNPPQIILCRDKDATVAYAGGTQDANDIVRYILYDGTPNNPRGGTILVFNDNGTFRFDPATMVLGKTYYIAAFVGNIDPVTGNILFSDRCMQATPGIPVTWYAYPVAVINGNQRLTCTVTSLNLNGTNSTSGSGQTVNYDWSTTNGRFTTGTTNGTVTVDRPGTYKLFVTDPVSGCTHETTYIITEDVTKPTVAIALPEEITCARPRVNLDGNGSSKGSIYTVNWTGSGPINNAQTYTADVGQAGTYTILVTNTDNGCVDTRTVTVTEDKVKPIPAIDQIGQLTCTVKEVQLDGSRSRGQSGLIGSYSWSTTNGSIVAGQGTGRLRVNKPGTYSLRVVDQKNGCDEITNIEVLEIGNPLLGFELLTQNPLCFGERNGGLDISNVFSNAPTDKVEFSFNNGAYTKNTTFSNLSQGNYSLKMRDENGCEKDTSFTLIEPSKLGIQVIRSIVVDQGTTVRLDSLLKLISGGTAPYSDTTWWNVNQNIDWEPFLTYQADTTRDFIITGIDASGCKIEDRVRVIVRILKDVWWPNVFAPNGQNNKIWNLKGKRVSNIKTLQIYDRWGEMVFSSENMKDGNVDPSVGWNGIFRGEKSLPGVYVFYAEVKFQGSDSFDKYKGEFTLLR